MLLPKVAVLVTYIHFYFLESAFNFFKIIPKLNFFLFLSFSIWNLLSLIFLREPNSHLNVVGNTDSLFPQQIDNFLFMSVLAECFKDNRIPDYWDFSLVRTYSYLFI